MDARQSRRGKRISLRQEKLAAADLGGRTTAGSGAAKFSGGGDVRVMGKIRLECKVTEKDTYRLHYSDLKKIRTQANKVLEEPVFQIAFLHPNRSMSKFAIIPWDGKKTDDVIKVLYSKSQSIKLLELDLFDALNLGRLQLSFYGDLEIPSFHRIFEIMHWDDFIEQQNTNA